MKFCLVILIFLFGMDSKCQYYICGGQYATKHHRNSSCRGLNNCQSDIYESSSNDGKDACSICGGGSSYDRGYYKTSDTYLSNPRYLEEDYYNLKSFSSHQLIFNSHETDGFQTRTVPYGKHWWVMRVTGRHGAVNQMYNNIKGLYEKIESGNMLYAFKNDRDGGFFTKPFEGNSISFWCYTEGETVEIYNPTDKVSSQATYIEVFEFDGKVPLQYTNKGIVGFYTKLNGLGAISITIDSDTKTLYRNLTSSDKLYVCCISDESVGFVLNKGIHKYRVYSHNTGKMWEGTFYLNNRENKIIEIK